MLPMPRLGLFLVLLSIAAFGQGSLKNMASSPDSETQQFVGGWRAVSITDTRADGTQVPDLYLGPHPVGILIYEATGYMCGQSMDPDRARWADGSNGTPAEMAAAAKGFDGYCGTYKINAKEKTVIHHVKATLVPNDVGADLVRKYEFSGNFLRLSGEEGLKPGFKFWTFTFERATPAT